MGGKRTTDVKATDRVRNHPGQSSESKQGNILFSNACATEVSKKESSIMTHIKVPPVFCS